MYFVENGDDGDSFNYSIPRQDMEIYSTAFKPIIQIKGSNLIQKATSNSKWLSTRSRCSVKKEATVKMLVELIIGLRKNSKVIDVQVNVDNHGLSHRLCVLFDVDLLSKQILQINNLVQ